MKKIFVTIAILIILSSFMVSCEFLPLDPSKTDGWKDTSMSTDKNNDITEDEIIFVTDDYEYLIVDGTVTLIKYTGKYTALIEVPTEIDELKVTKIASGCFTKTSNVFAYKGKKNSAQTSTYEDNEESDFSTYLIGNGIEMIEEGTFEENSTFITPCLSMPKGWNDTNMYGSAKDGSGNIYYDTTKEDTIVSQGIVYVKDELLGGLYVARCLTNRKEVEIPSHVDGQPVIDIGREAFSHNKHIEKVTLPNTIGYVYYYAFYNCKNLKEVVFNCPNLSKILSNSFNGCISLDIVRLPENNTYIQKEAFSNCGKISELYIPFSMTNIAPKAFANTTIDKIIYSGTKEQWSLIKIAEDVAAIFESAEISFAANQIEQTLKSLIEIKDVELNTFVTFEGVITGFYNEKGVWVTDVTNNYSIFCYNDHGLPFSDLDYIGKTIRVSGTKILYTGQIEVTQCEIEILDIPKTEIKPIELDLADPDLNLSDYLNYYVVVQGVYEYKSYKSLYIEGSDIPLYNQYFFPDSPVPASGDTIEVVGWVYTFNQLVEILYDSRLLIIK